MTIIGIGVALLIVRSALARDPLPVVPVAPTVVILTRPPTAVPTPTATFPAPTTIPTFTPIPTPDTAVAPAEITVGFYAQVFNTEGAGLTVRGGPSVSNVPLAVAPEESLLLVTDGPVADDVRLWWQVELSDGTSGWVAGDFLQPAAAP